MNEEQLRQLLYDLESDRVERKANYKSHREEIRRNICAFANDLGQTGRAGVLFVGAHPDGQCNQEETVNEQLLETLADMRANGQIVPFPVMRVQRLVVNDGVIAVVVVEPSTVPPVRFSGRVWVRVGPTLRPASAEEERILSERRRARDLPFDVQALPSATLDDLDREKFRQTYLPYAIAPEVLAQNERPFVQQLQSLRLVWGEHPTVLGMLTVGKNPRQFIPNAYVQFLRIHGRELTDPIIDQKEISGTLDEILNGLDELLNLNITIATSLTAAPQEARRPDYPFEALRQLTRNAILHRNYQGTNAPVRLYWFSDRIEIHSPGGPYGQVTPENFGTLGLTDYRNPHLAEVLKNMGYVQRFGFGLPAARKQLQDNDNPPLEFKITQHTIVAIVWRRP